MASNEHAYLSEANLHNPKGLVFSVAIIQYALKVFMQAELEWVADQVLFSKTDNCCFCQDIVTYQLQIINILPRYDTLIIKPHIQISIMITEGPTISSGTTVAAKALFSK